ncbi:MAG: hypothetical protein QNJ73_06515 [Gammaproteobacteria bacterium]|nr:hypothetical protein [Gammaproteobacteria bacterium]
MTIRCLFLLAVLAIVSTGVQAADLALTDDDCRALLERYAVDPDSVPQHLVDDCQERLADSAVPALAPAAGVAAAGAADPCAGPNAASSVLCWGPWSALAPAAAGDPLPDTPVDIDDPDVRPELASQFDPDVTPLGDDGLPLGSCQPGTPCGFATVVAGVTSNAPAEDTEFARFDLATDGSEFTVRPGETNEIASVTGMGTVITDRPDQYDNLRATGADGDQRSRLIARVIRNNGQIESAADVWADGNVSTGAAQSGYFAWGRATSQADLDALNSSAVTRSLNFTGPMSVDNSTIAAIRLDFGPQSGWSGNWTNPAWSFAAGGTISGADFISTPDQFSGNVQQGSFVQGALLGSQDRHSVAHIIDVSLENVGRVRDVGLLQQSITP